MLLSMDRMVRARVGAQSTEIRSDCTLILQTGRHVSFTGSVAVGRRDYAEARLTNGRRR